MKTPPPGYDRMPNGTLLRTLKTGQYAEIRPESDKFGEFFTYAVYYRPGFTHVCGRRDTLSEAHDECEHYLDALTGRSSNAPSSPSSDRCPHCHRLIRSA